VGDDHNVHDSVVVADRANHGFAKKRGIQADVARGLVEQAARIEVASAEQQLRGDRRNPSAFVQMIGGAKQPVVFLRVAEIEYLDGIDLDPTDACACGFELGVRRQRLVCLLLCRRRPIVGLDRVSCAATGPEAPQSRMANSSRRMPGISSSEHPPPHRVNWTTPTESRVLEPKGTERLASAIASVAK